VTAKHRRPTDADYIEMAASYADEPPRPDEVRWMEIGPGLRKGRPRRGVASSGKTPLTAVPLPDEIRAELARRAKAEGSSASELIRQAIIEYFGHHPV
jgi:hypothetical protein